METTAQIDLWCSEFGAAYTARNDFAQPARIDAWRRVLDGIAPTRVVEVGCNVGWNLVYLSQLGVDELYGVEPQRGAVKAARARYPDLNVLVGTGFDVPFRDGFADLAFTSGVLIHIAPSDVDAVIGEIYRVSRRWIVAIEYDSPSEQSVSYRGVPSALWKRDHGALWRSRHPDLRLIRRLELGAADGYDDCTAHVFEKTR